MIRPISRGAYGRVYEVKKKSTGGKGDIRMGGGGWGCVRGVCCRMLLADCLLYTDMHFAEAPYRLCCAGVWDALSCPDGTCCAVLCCAVHILSCTTKQLLCRNTSPPWPGDRFAIKVMTKTELAQKNMVESVTNEKNILALVCVCVYVCVWCACIREPPLGPCSRACTQVRA